MALVLAIGLVPQFFSMWHLLGLECSSWLFYSHVESLGRDGWTAGDWWVISLSMLAWASSQYGSQAVEFLTW